MVIWRITGDEIGPEGCGAAHFATRSEAEKAIRDYREWCRDNGKTPYVDGPTKLVISNRSELANALDQAMGFGGT